MNTELVKKIAIYSGIAVASIAAIGITSAVIRNKRFSGKGKGQGEGAGIGNKNELVGKTINVTGSSAYLRSTPEIPNNTAGTCMGWEMVYNPSCWVQETSELLLGDDTKTNVVGTIKGNAGGVKINKVVVGKDGFNWFYLEGAEVSGNIAWGNTPTKKNGYVREDVVSVNF